MNYFFNRNGGWDLSLRLGVEVAFVDWAPPAMRKDWGSIVVRLTFGQRTLTLRFPIGEKAKRVTPAWMT